MRHGGYSLLVRSGEIPERMTHVRRYLDDARLGLVRDIAGREEALTAAQRILIDRTMGLLSVLRTIEESLSERGIMQGSVLTPILRENYLSYQNAVRLNLAALGINRKEGAGVVDLGCYLAKKKTGGGEPNATPPQL